MSAAMWNDLRAHLSQRRERGWYLDEDEMAWCFGLAGACRVSVAVRDGRYVVYDADTDEERTFTDLDALAAALPALEHSHRGFSALYRQILDSPIRLDPVELAEHQRQLAAQDAALDADPPADG